MPTASAMTATDSLTAPPAAQTRRAGWSLYGLALVALALVYVPVLINLVEDWGNDPNYSHGFIIPFAVAYFVWQQRHRLRALPARPSDWGLAIVLVSQAEYLIGYLGAEYFLQRTSLLLLIAGGIIYLYGWRHLQAHLFSLALLFMAVPLPEIVFNSIAFPLQLLASAWAAALLTLSGIPVFREGNVLALPYRTLDVAEACSGIRSLFSLIALAMMVAYFIPARAWWRLVVVASAVPIALAANAFRIFATGWLGKLFGPEYSEGFFHAFSGWLIFVVAFVLLLLEVSLISRLSQRKRRSAPTAEGEA